MGRTSIGHPMQSCAGVMGNGSLISSLTLPRGQLFTMPSVSIDSVSSCMRNRDDLPITLRRLSLTDRGRVSSSGNHSSKCLEKVFCRHAIEQF